MSTVQRILETLEEAFPSAMTANEIAVALGISRRNTSHHLRQLEARHLIHAAAVRHGARVGFDPLEFRAGRGESVASAVPQRPRIDPFAPVAPVCVQPDFALRALMGMQQCA